MGSRLHAADVHQLLLDVGVGSGLTVSAVWKAVFEVGLLDIIAFLLLVFVAIASMCSSLAASCGVTAHILVDLAPAVECIVLALVSAINVSPTLCS